MKKITLMIFVSLMSFFAYSQGLPVYSFDDPWVQGAWGTNPAPPEWVVINASGPNRWWVQTDPNNTAHIPFGGTGFSAHIDRETAAPAAPIPSDYLITKRFEVPANGELKFQSRLTLGTDNGGIYRVYIAEFVNDTEPTVANMTALPANLLKQYTELELNPLQTEWTQKTLTIPAAWAGKQVRIAFQMEGSNKDRWFIDDVSVLPACLAPTNPVVTATTTTTATLSWTSSGVTSWEVEVVPDTVDPTGVGVPYNGTLPYTAINLTPCTQYKFYVRSNCNGGTKSPWAGPIFFKARCIGENCADPIVIPPGTNYSTTNNTANFSDFYEGVPGTGCNSTGNYLAGNDVVYSFTPSVTGNYNINLSNTGGAAGMFIYSSCANIGTACINGALASATAAANIPSQTLTAGTTYYIVISTNGTPQTTNYTLIIQQVFCAQPTNGVANTITGTTANLIWTAGTAGASSWQVAVQNAGSGLPATGANVTSNTGYGVSATTAGVPFAPATAYEFYVRESCGGGQYSIWAGPYQFTTTQVAATLPLIQNFDGSGSHGFTLANGTQINKWVVGGATNNSPSNSLYVSNDNGVTNNYNNASSSVVHAYRDVQMPPTVGQLALSFDWKGFAESCCDYIRVWVVPATWTPTPGTQITTGNSGGIQIGGNLNNTTAWQTYTTILSPTGWNGTTRRLVFEWRNDGDTGSSPAGAIDNINWSVVTCPQPVNLTVGTLTPAQGTVSWTAPAIVPASYDVYVSENSSTPPTATTVPTIDNVTGTSANITPLTPSSTYFVWVRSDCSPTDKSFWTGPVSFNTPQIPATIPYAQNFDATGPHNFTLSNGTQTNKWFVGTAVSNSPTKSLYVSDSPTGATNSYSHTTTRVHAYRDIEIPASLPTGQLLFKFDWRNQGEGSFDFVRVWNVPLTYSPTPGTQISAANSGGVQIGGNFEVNANWSTSSSVITIPAAWNGTVRRFIFEWSNDGGGGSNPPGAIDNIDISIITCAAPTGLALGTLTTNSANITWTAPAGAPASYDYYMSTNATAPTETTVPSGNVVPTNATIGSLTPSTNYNVWVRSNCGTAGTSFWVGPLNFNTPQIPATMPYTQNFDGTTPHNFTLNNGTQTNKWFVGTAVSNSPSSSLYISDNATGATNAYSHTTTRVHAYRDIEFPAVNTLGQVLLKFDWRSLGENNFDFVRVWIVPINYSPVAGTQITAGASGGVQVGGNFQLNGSWSTANNIVTVPAAWNGTIRRVIFEWSNDGGGGNNPPAAIDNIEVSVVKCPAPSNLIAGAINALSATFSWTAPSPAPAGYDYYLTTSPIPPATGTVPTGSVTSPTISLTGLPDGTNYYIWVRSNCGAPEGPSHWIGPVNFNTPQIPATLPYEENFDAGNPHYSYINGTQANKWVVGGATFNSPSTSMYVSNDNGISNNFTFAVASTVHSYRDVVIPAGVTNLDLAFDWKNAGDTNDFLRVWMVPLSFNPVPGTAITAAADRILVTPTNLFGSNIWKTASYVVPVTAGTTQRFVFQWVNNASGGTTAGAIDNVSIKALTCPKPTAQTATLAGMTDVTLGWTEAGTATNWDVYVVPADGPVPSEATPGVDAPTNPFVYEGLAPSTFYDYYVRANCGPGDNSRWTGPFRFNTNSCELEDQCTFDFVLTDSGNNGWQGVTMNVTQAGITKVILGPQLTSGGGPVTVAVPLCEGIPYEVFFVQGGTNPQQAGLQIINPGTGQAVFQRVAGTTAYDMNTVIYTGIVSCSAITCPQPTNLASTSVVNAANTTELTWTPGGTETQWEVIVQGEGDGFPSANPTNAVLVNDEPSHIVENLVPSEPYEYYVRAICGPGEKSFWSGPLKYSIFTPPACADVTVIDDDSLEVIAPDTEYVICPGEELCVNFSADFYTAAAQTTSYEITSIPFVPPFPTLGGTSLPVGSDDIWSPRVNLPFEFCFMGNVYNAAQIGANGVVTFDANYASGAFNAWSYSESLPSGGFPIKNAIFGVYQDTDPRTDLNTWDNPNINYQVLGNYPCRALVVSFNELAQYNCSSNSAADQAVGPQSSQIVIYEITNIIEVYVKRRVPCYSTHNGARGVIGLLDTTGTQAYVPPGRNTGTWTAIEEAWRFTPNGDTSVVFEWLKNGSFLSNSTAVEVCSTGPGTTVMTARATYALCTGENAVRESNFTIRVEEQIIPAADPADLTKCGNGEDVTFDLNVAVADVFADPTGYDFTFYPTEQDAIDNTNAVAAPDAFVTNVTTTVWVRINKADLPCFITRSFDVIISNVAPLFGITPSTSICDGTSATVAVIPDPAEDLTGATYSWTLDGNPLTDTTASIVATAAGVYEVTVNKNGCVGTATFTLAIVPNPVAETIADADVCDNYTLPAFANPDNNNSNTYYTGPGATGIALSPGEIIGNDPDSVLPAGTHTIYVYSVNTDGVASCSDESSFTVIVTASPSLDAIADVNSCDSYILPALTGNNAGADYFTGPDGSGTQLDAGDEITATQLVYVYQAEGNIPCTSEVSFNVVITATPVADAPADVNECDSYVLPALSAGNNYYTGPGKTGTMLSAGETVTTTQLIYVFAEAAANVNCTAENTFTVNITNTPQFNLGGPYTSCVASNLTIGVNALNFDADANTTSYLWTVNGIPTGGNTKSITGTEFGTYEVTVTVNGLCSHTESIQVEQDTDAVEVTFMENCEGGTYYVEVVDVEGSFNIDTATYEWVGPEGFASADRKIVPPVQGEYIITVTTADGCVAIDSFEVLSTTCEIPRGISPNGDGLNDNFDLTALGVRKLSIYNRYGQEVYSRNNYTNEWVGQGSNGDELPTGTYFYMVERSNGESKTGWVYINRQQ